MLHSAFSGGIACLYLHASANQSLQPSPLQWVLKGQQCAEIKVVKPRTHGELKLIQILEMPSCLSIKNQLNQSINSMKIDACVSCENMPPDLVNSL
jgi:hypothetical protein